MHDYDSFNEDVICTLAMAVGEDNVALVEPMSRHTTFQIGGPADVLVTPETPEALVKALDACAIAGAPVTVVGNGSDLLVGDRGIRGVVVLLRENFSGISVEGTRVTAEAGALLRDVALAAADAGLSGLEPLWGIPATVGGACFMNAGAYDACTADVLESVTVYVPGGPDEGGARLRGTVRTLGRDELGMGVPQEPRGERGARRDFCHVCACARQQRHNSRGYGRLSAPSRGEAAARAAERRLHL